MERGRVSWHATVRVCRLGRFPKAWKILVLPTLLAAAQYVALAQDDSSEQPLGDVARSLRKKSQPSQTVIDNDNLSTALEQAEGRPAEGAALRFAMEGASKAFRISAPDVTCSLSFSANAKSLLETQYAEMELPANDLAKLEGQAVIEGDAFTLPIFNDTNWHVSEVTVALTVVRKIVAGIESGLDPAAGIGLQVRVEKKQDVTKIYRMRTAAPPFSRAVFNAPLGMQLAEGDEWHWAIVQGRGYPPQGTESEPTPKLTSLPTMTPARDVAAEPAKPK